MLVEQQQTFNAAVSGEIRAEMGRRNMSQTELARRLGWAQSALSRRLGGHIPFSLAELELIAEALGVEPFRLTSPRAS